MGCVAGMAGTTGGAGGGRGGVTTSTTSGTVGGSGGGTVGVVGILIDGCRCGIGGGVNAGGDVISGCVNGRIICEFGTGGIFIVRFVVVELVCVVAKMGGLEVGLKEGFVSSVDGAENGLNFAGGPSCVVTTGFGGIFGGA